MIQFLIICLIIGFIFSVEKVVTDKNIKSGYGFEKGKQPSYSGFLWWILVVAFTWPLGVWFTLEPIII